EDGIRYFHVTGVQTCALPIFNESPVKKYAAEHNLPVFQPEKLRNCEFLEQMKSLDADVFVVVAFRLMPKVLFELPKLGTFNLHRSEERRVGKEWRELV